MDSTDPLSQLADIRLPEEVGFWPPAPGWWLLFFLFLGLMVFALLKLRQRLHHQRLYRYALAELDKCLQQYREQTAGMSADQDDSQQQLDYVNNVNAVLRRVALKHFAQEQVASLSGEQWVQFLRHNGDASLLDQELARALSQGRFARRCQVDPQALHQMAQQWIKSLYLARINSEESTSDAAADHA